MYAQTHGSVTLAPQPTGLKLSEPNPQVSGKVPSSEFTGLPEHVFVIAVGTGEHVSPVKTGASQNVAAPALDPLKFLT